MEKRYQVFISSTYLDLREERSKVMQTLLELECFPSGMELFPAADDNSWTLIQSVIDECDYFVLIVAGRYGSWGDEEKSYTQKEYEYAISIGKPVIAFVHADIKNLPGAKLEETEEGKEKLNQFRAKCLEDRACKQWSNADDLANQVMKSLLHLKKTKPAIGWVRADKVATIESMQEILQLKKENEELKLQLQQLGRNAPTGSESLAQGQDKHRFTFIYTAYSSGALLLGEKKGEVEISWNRLIAWLSPLLLNDTSESELQEYLAAHIQSYNLNDFKRNFPDANKFKVVIYANVFGQILVQLKALGIIKKGTRKRPLNDTQRYWTLTAFGEATMIQLLAVRKKNKKKTT